MRLVAQVSGAKLALLSRSSTTRRTRDSKYLFWAEFFFHCQGDNAPELMRRHGQFRTLSSKLGSVRTLCLAGILALAFVRGKLKLESLLCVRDPPHGRHGNLELAIAKSADSDCGDRPKPFAHPKITLWHGQPCRRRLGGRLSSWRIGTLKLKPWRGRLWFSYRSSVLEC
jgi:hypothetical protein